MSHLPHKCYTYPMIKAIIFDCFGVLCLDSHQSLTTRFPGAEQALRDLNTRSDYGLVSHEAYVTETTELTGLSPTEVSEFISSEHHQNQELFAYILSLRPRFKTAVLSNVGLGWFNDFISPTDQHKYFDVIVNSGKEGLVKPDPKIFALTAERLGVAPAECVMIDDIDRNCAGAELAGMSSINYSDNARTIALLEDMIFKE
jgi:epoxide hydrolase-like predicted phosphatase